MLCSVGQFWFTSELQLLVRQRLAAYSTLVCISLGFAAPFSMQYYLEWPVFSALSELSSISLQSLPIYVQYSSTSNTPRHAILASLH